MEVEVAYARPDKQQIVPVVVPPGTTALEAVKLSRIIEIFPEIDPDAIDMGVFGKVVKNPAEHVLREGDRVELYRPLKIDPKQGKCELIGPRFPGKFKWLRGVLGDDGAIYGIPCWADTVLKIVPEIRPLFEARNRLLVEVNGTCGPVCKVTRYQNCIPVGRPKAVFQTDRLERKPP